MPPRRKWRAITIATLLLVPAFWSLLAGLVAAAQGGGGGPDPALAVTLGLVIIPFVFTVLAFLSEHPSAPGAVLRAMGLSLLVGIPVSVIAGDGVTGMVAGMGAGGIVSLRAERPHDRRARAAAVIIGSVVVFFLARVAGAIVLLPAPFFCFTTIGIADLLSESRWDAGAEDPGAVID